MLNDAALQWQGRTMVSSDGDKLGTVEEIYLDQETDRPEWALVKTGLFGTKSSFVPIANAQEDGDDLRVPFSKDKVSDAPRMDSDGELAQSEEAALYRHYGMDYSEARSDSGLPEGGAGGDVATTGRRDTVGDDVSGDETDDEMTRSEEEVRVGKVQREVGRARLRKHIVTEDVQKTVPVRREQVRIEREPITDANIDRAMSGPELSEEEHEVVLHEEEVVVDKQVVPKERVRLDKEVVTEERRVSEDVHKEQIDMVDGADAPREGIDGVRGTDGGIGR